MVQPRFNLIGIDVKPRRTAHRPRRNRYKSTSTSVWLFPAALVLLTLVFVAFGWTR